MAAPKKAAPKNGRRKGIMSQTSDEIEDPLDLIPNEDEESPSRQRKKAAVQMSRNVKSVPGVKDVTQASRSRPVGQGSGKRSRGSRSGY